MTPWPKDPIRYEAMRKERSEFFKERFKNKENHPRYGKHIIINPDRRIEVWFSKLEQRIPRKTIWRIWLSEHKKGKNNPFYGRHPSELARKKNSEAHQGHKMLPHVKEAIIKSNLGIKRSPETGQKISIANKGRKFTEQHKKNLRQSRLYQVFPTRDTKPEKMLQLALILHGIKFEKHKAIVGQPDIFIEPNICIFVDGDFWHANPDKYGSEFKIVAQKKAKDVWARDIQTTHILNELGYQVIRIWESKIKEDANVCAENIYALLESCRRVEQ